MSKLSARKVLVAYGEETEYGVPPVPPSAVAQGDLSGLTVIPVTDFSFSPNVDTVKRKSFKPSLSPSASLISKVYNEFSFTTEISDMTPYLALTLFPIASLKVDAIEVGAERKEFTGDGSTTKFQLSKPINDDIKNALINEPRLASVKIHFNGAPEFIPWNFSEDNNGNLQIEFEKAPQDGAEIEVIFPNRTGGLTSIIRPASVSKSVSFYIILDRLLFVVSGAKADLSIEMEANDTPKLRFKVRGLYIDPIAVQNVNFSCSDTVPPLVRDTFTLLRPANPSAIYGGLIDLQKFELSLDNDIAQFESVNAVAGVGAFEITERNTTLSLDGDMLDIPDFYKDVMQGQAFTFMTSLTWKNDIGRKGYMRLFTDSYIPSSLDFGERNGIRTITTKGNLVGCDDEFVLVLSSPGAM